MSTLFRFDFTLNAEMASQDKIAETLREWCNKWIFQLEKSESGYVHYQGRINMMKPKRLEQAIKLWQDLLPTIHISATSNACKTFDYVMKADTRVDGPWNNDQPVQRMTAQLSEFMDLEMYGWQKDVLALCDQQDFRHIHVILDDVGNTGKSIFAEYLEYKGLAYEIPMMNNMEDIMQCAMGIPPQRCYLIDMPRGLKKEKLASFYAGIECLKNGVMYDKRYAFKKRRITRPQILVFTNAMPELQLLSPDRWAIHRITGLMNMIDVEIGGENGTPGATL